MSMMQHSCGHFSPAGRFGIPGPFVYTLPNSALQKNNSAEEYTHSNTTIGEPGSAIRQRESGMREVQPQEPLANHKQQ
jgi:hypothetical protein